jgi:hypothetical protein
VITDVKPFHYKHTLNWEDGDVLYSADDAWYSATDCDWNCSGDFIGHTLGVDLLLMQPIVHGKD